MRDCQNCQRRHTCTHYNPGDPCLLWRPEECAKCHRPIPDDAERWPHGDGYQCQECWEDESGAAWWEVTQAIGEVSE